jgi:hypothetical protein
MHAKWFASLGAAVVVVGAMMASACGAAGRHGSSALSCVSVPESIPNRVLADLGAKLTIHTGSVVFAVVEAGNVTGGPGFPWRQTETSDPRVLVRVHLCKITGPTTIPESITGFRAIGEGTAAMFAPLATGWRHIPNRPPAYRATVRVLP